MSKILFFLLSRGNTTTTYSNRLIANKLIDLGYDVEIIYDDEDKKRILSNPQCDTIFFQKTIQCAYHTSQKINHLKGKVNLIHIDDDFQDMQNENHIHTLQISDLVLVGTDKHKKALGEIIETPIERFDCLLDYDYYPLRKNTIKLGNKIVISWQQSCADAFYKDLLQIAEPLNRIMDNYSIQLDLYGWHEGKDYTDNSPKVKEVLPRANYIPYVPYATYVKEVVPQIAKTDIFILPYSNEPSRWGKSGFGLKRIMLMEIPVVVTHTEHFERYITQGKNGFLASTSEEWYLALEQLVKSKALRQECGENARNFLIHDLNNNIVIRDFIKVVNKHASIFTKH